MIAGQLHDAGLDGGAVSALAGDQDVVAVVGRADADRLQAAVGADRVRELLELAIVVHLAAWVEGFGNDYARERDVAELHAAVRRSVDLRPVVCVGCCGGGHVALPCVKGPRRVRGRSPTPGTPGWRAKWEGSVSATGASPDRLALTRFDAGSRRGQSSSSGSTPASTDSSRAARSSGRLT